MEKILGEMVSGKEMVSWLIIAFLVLYFVYKEWPEFKRRMSSGSITEAKDELTAASNRKRLEVIEEAVVEINGKLDRDYRRINEMEKELARNRKSQQEDRDEMLLLMRGLLAALKGLQQLNCNGPVTESIDTITTYLTAKAHEYDDSGWKGDTDD